MPIGGGLKLSLGNNWTIAGALIGRLTLTDYLDDTSDNHADYNFVYKYNSRLAAFLSNRMDEFHELPEGAIGSNFRARGVGKPIDYYFTIMVGIHYTLKKNIFRLGAGT